MDIAVIPFAALGIPGALRPPAAASAGPGSDTERPLLTGLQAAVNRAFGHRDLPGHEIPHLNLRQVELIAANNDMITALSEATRGLCATVLRPLQVVDAGVFDTASSGLPALSPDSRDNGNGIGLSLALLPPAGLGDPAIVQGIAKGIRSHLAAQIQDRPVMMLGGVRVAVDTCRQDVAVIDFEPAGGTRLAQAQREELVAVGDSTWLADRFRPRPPAPLPPPEPLCFGGMTYDDWPGINAVLEPLVQAMHGDVARLSGTYTPSAQTEALRERLLHAVPYGQQKVFIVAPDFEPGAVLDGQRGIALGETFGSVNFDAARQVAAHQVSRAPEGQAHGAYVYVMCCNSAQMRAAVDWQNVPPTLLAGAVRVLPDSSVFPLPAINAHSAFWPETAAVHELSLPHVDARDVVPTRGFGVPNAFHQTLAERVLPGGTVSLQTGSAALPDLESVRAALMAVGFPNVEMSRPLGDRGPVAIQATRSS